MRVQRVKQAPQGRRAARGDLMQYRVLNPAKSSIGSKNMTDATTISSGLFSKMSTRLMGALTASGYRIKQRDADTQRRLIQPWQQRSFHYYDTVPEIKYAAQFYSRALSVLRLFPARRDESGEIEEIGADGASLNDVEKQVVEQLERVQDPGGGRSGLLASYGRLRFLAGESYLFVTRDPETEREQWEMLSTDELRVTGSGYVRYKAPSLQQENFEEPSDDDFAPIDDKTAVAYRLWQRHPRFSYLADSTMQGVLDICEELVLLTQAVRSRARSRLAGSGLLLVNGKLTPVPFEAVPDENPDEDPFMAALLDAMTKPIVDEGTAAAVVPLVVRVDVDELDNVMKLIQFVDPTQIYPETGLRMECIKRLSIGLDMPPEILMGLQDSNHWSAWQIDEQTWKAHLQPVAQALVDDLTSSFFQPSLRAAGVEGWQDYFVAFDAAAVINHPDRTKDAKDLHDREALSDHALREASGFTDDDAITDQEEYNRRVGLKLRDGSFVKYGEPSIKAGGIQTGADELLSPQADGAIGNGTHSPPPASEVTGNAQAAEVDADHPEVPELTGSANGNGAATFTHRLMGACDITLYRARELAGSRLRNHVKRDKTLSKLIDGVPAGQVAATIGRDKAIPYAAARDLVRGVEPLLADALRIWQIDEALAAPLADRIEQHAARTLFEARPKAFPQTFISYLSGLYQPVKAK